MYKTLYKGSDMLKFNCVRDILDREKIPYKYHVKDPKSGWLDFLFFLPARSVTGSFESVECSKIYCVFVPSKYKDRAQKLLNIS